jgi:electron transport complex protein RnfB
MSEPRMTRSTRADADAIERLLPQTQCTRCGFAGCRPYAEAIAAGKAAINRCPPGGTSAITRLAALTGHPAMPLDPACGPPQPRRSAWIDPAACIGCTKCIQACPVDAIIGASQWNHAVLTEQCTGCERCVPPCPMDCIRMRAPIPSMPWSDADAVAAKTRFEARAKRLGRNRHRNDERLAAKALGKLAAPQATAESPLGDDPNLTRKRAIVQAAIQRARARLRT